MVERWRLERGDGGGTAQMRIFGEGIDELMIVETKAGFSRSCLRDWSNGIEDVWVVTSPSSGRIKYLSGRLWIA